MRSEIHYTCVLLEVKITSSCATNAVDRKTSQDTKSVGTDTGISLVD